MVIVAGAYLSLVIGLWSGWRTMVFLGQPGEPLPLRIFYALDTLAFFFCFAGLMRRRRSAWFLFLILIVQLIFYSLLAVYVFIYRLVQGSIFSVQYEIFVGIATVAIIILLFGCIWLLTKSSIRSQFDLPFTLEKDRFLWFGGISLIAVLVISTENLLIPVVAWGLASFLMGITIGIFWLVVSVNFRS